MSSTCSDGSRYQSGIQASKDIANRKQFVRALVDINHGNVNPCTNCISVHPTVAKTILLR